ncbi:MAG: hypothetical protein MUP71_12590, partial [Candidatus Aminicenantes bacterium]|nr:hypothetical protein [Candidatus Aminicenantes bacterium]
MSIKKLFYFAAILAMAAGPVFSQVKHDNDDRDLFIGVGSSTAILPNILVMADNSGSMNSAIYYSRYYDPKIDYSKAADGSALNLDVDSDLDGFTFDDTFGSFSTISKLQTFNICRGRSQATPVWDSRARFSSLYKSDPNRWIVYKNTISGTFPVIGQVIDYDGAGSGIDDEATIIGLTEKRDYWIITVANYNGTPNASAYIYINYRLEMVFDTNEARFVPVGESCTGFTDTFTDVKLYGSYDLGVTTNPKTRYDRNYLYWLAFYTDQAQVDAVTYWATTGKFPDKSGNLVDAGYTRISVLRRVLGDVMREVHADVNLGLAAFNADNHGGYISENLTNFNSDTSIDEMIKTNIDKMIGNTNTPLAETLAKCWYYIIGQNTKTLEPHTDASVAADCPINYKCQKNYVILMTDGQATYDEFTEDTGALYYQSYFARTDIEVWGDKDANDPPFIAENNWGSQPTNLTKPDGMAYCPLNSCWGLNGINGSYGTDYLDDVAYYMSHTDHFSDAVFDPCYGITDPTALATCQESNAYKVFSEKYEGAQTIETYVIGFNQDNDMLTETAKNGNGEYYTANSYNELKTALTNAIVSIQLRNMAFAAFTAPKKITSTVGEGFSYVGYFMPSALSPIWTGHLQSFKMTDRWYYDANNNKVLDTDETTYEYQSVCESANSGMTCLREVALATVPEWDTQQKVTDNLDPRQLFTHNSDVDVTTLIPFTLANVTTLQPLFGLPTVEPDPLNPTYLPQAQSIITTISGKTLGDIFHSDIAYVGPPLPGKKYVKNINPPACSDIPLAGDPDCYENLLKTYGATTADPDSGRDKLLYVGSNDGIMHQVDAKTGEERWGFIPDEVLPTLKSIVIDGKYSYTVDGRVAADDIYDSTAKSWKTIVVFGLKDGGYSFYALDVTAAGSQPVVLWKFKDDDYSGKSWSKPFFGKIRFQPESGEWIHRWVVIFSGGMAFNYGDTTDTEGKAVFVVDAVTGELIWMIGYNASGTSDNTTTAHIDTAVDTAYTGPGERYLTAKPEFNYPIPSAITPVDRDSDGFLDSIYFGNVAGHLFKADISPKNPADWKTHQLFKATITHLYPTTCLVSGNVITVGSAAGYELHRNIFQPTTGAYG